MAPSTIFLASAILCPIKFCGPKTFGKKNVASINGT